MCRIGLIIAVLILGFSTALRAQFPGQTPVSQDDGSTVGGLFDGGVVGDDDIGRVTNLRDEVGSAGVPHPLGLLPNPVIRTDTRYTYEDMIWRTIDTSIIGFHEYSPTQQWRYPYVDLGVLGQNYKALFFDPSFTTGNSTGFDAYSKYWYKPENVKYYNTKIPFTSLYYNLGKSAENHANVIHSQNIGPYYNAAFDYRLMNMKGAYANQKALIHNLNINNWYNSKNHRYSLMFAFLFNKMVNFENGGIDFDNFFSKENAGASRPLVPVHLDEAINRANNKSLYLKQRQFLGPVRTVSTSDTSTLDLVQRTSALSYTFQYDRWKYEYDDEQSDDDFYDQFFFDSTATADSTAFWTVKLGVRWENTPETYTDSTKKIAPNRYFLSLDYEHTKYNNQGLRRKWDNLSLSGGFNSNVLQEKRWHYGVSAEVHLSPGAIGDYRIGGFLRWKINDMMNLKVLAESRRSNPSQRVSEFQSNHFVWNNDFSPVFHQKLSLVFRCDHGDIDGELTFHNVNRFIYMDENRDFRQASTPLNVLLFTAGKAFDWKNFYLYHGIGAQYVANRSVLELPKFYIKQRFQYQGGFFSGLLTAHLGFDITYHTDYYADAYNPATMDFYRQNSERQKFYPVMDLFFEIFIKRARLFFLMQHVNQGMFGQKGYYTAKDYPAQDRAFKMGVSWQFYD